MTERRLPHFQAADKIKLLLATPSRKSGTAFASVFLFNAKEKLRTAFARAILNEIPYDIV